MNTTPCRTPRGAAAGLAAAGIASAALAVAGVFCAGAVEASSHREAPFIAGHPQLDGTDFYMFNSYEPGRQGFVTLIANYVPLQDAYGGPNYFKLDPTAAYDIHIDNAGDNTEHLTFRFRFTNSFRNLQVPVGGKSISIPLTNSAPLSAPLNPPELNVVETYTVELIRGNSGGSGGGSPGGNARMDRRDDAGGRGQKAWLTDAATGSRTFEKPVDNIGQKTIPDYASYAARHIYAVNIPGCPVQGRMFVGQRKEGFAVNLGEIFDTVNIPTARVIGSRSGGQSVTADKNVTSLALEVPASCLASAGDPVIGGWTTSSVPRQAMAAGDIPGVASAPGDVAPGTRDGRDWLQVSRLGMPLVNEVVIGLQDKDRFNASHPANDGQFADYVTNPFLPALLAGVYGSAGVKAPTLFPRADLVAVFLQGVAGVNRPASGKALSEMLRLNTKIPATPLASQNSLGAAACFDHGALKLTNAGCDPSGFPNGRRPGDDVVDIELRVAMGYLLPDAVAPSGQLPYTDGALVQASDFDNAFPYLRTPLPGSPNGPNGVPANP